jgi:uncharacterized protein (DUF433 family)
MDDNTPQDRPGIVSHQRIEATLGICGGKPRIAGTRIRVLDVYVWHELLGQTADEIVAQFPQLTPADVYAALAYYWEHREKIQEHLRQAGIFTDELKANEPSPVAEKLAGKDVSKNPLSR